MTIEERIEKLTSAIEANTAALVAVVGNAAAPAAAAAATEKKARTAKAEKPADPKPETAAAAPTVTLDQLREQGQKLLDAQKEGVIRDIAAKFGQKRLRDLDPKDYASALTLLQEAVKALDSAL